MGNVEIKAGSIVKLFSAGWHVPQVLPLPLNVSLKKRNLPFSINAACGSIGEGGGLEQEKNAVRHRGYKIISFIIRGLMALLLSRMVRL